MPCEASAGLFYDAKDFQCNAICGDGIVVLEEECDDGNIINKDGCSSTCKIENLLSGCDYKLLGIKNCLK